MIKRLIFYAASFIVSLFFATAAQAEQIDEVDYEVSKPLPSELQIIQQSPVAFAASDYRNGFFDKRTGAYTLSGGDNLNNVIDNVEGESINKSFTFADNKTLTITLNDAYTFGGFYVDFANSKGGGTVISEITKTQQDKLIVQFYLKNKLVKTSETKSLTKINLGRVENYNIDVVKADKVTVKNESRSLIYTFIREFELYEAEKIYLAAENLKVSNVTHNSALISWINPDDPEISTIKLNGEDVGLVTNKKINGLKEETNYEAVVEVVYKDGTTIKATVNYKTLTEPKPPSDVSSLSATKTHAQVKLTWSSAEKDDVEYVIYRKKKGGVSLFSLFADGSTKIGTTDSKTYVDATVKSATNYTYTVTTLSKVNALESAGKSVDVTTDAEPVITEPPLDPTKPEKKGDDWVINWTQPKTGKIKVVVGGKEYKIVAASDLKVVIKNSDMVFDIWGNPDVQLIHISDDGTTQPPVPPPGSGGIGDVDLGDTITANNLLKVAMGLFALVASIVLLRMSFIVVPKLIKLIKNSSYRGGAK